MSLSSSFSSAFLIIFSEFLIIHNVFTDGVWAVTYLDSFPISVFRFPIITNYKHL